MSLIALPVLSSDIGLSKYLQQIARFPILAEEEEHDIAVRWHKFHDLKAAHMLITSHLRLVAKIALKFSGYGVPIVDVISEGNLGLMHAVRKFDPYNGARFSTYAMLWIKAYIQDYILKSWSMVKVGTSAAKKRLFYNLNRIKNRITNYDSTKGLETADISKIANELDVSTADVTEMDEVMSNPMLSLNDAAYAGDDASAELIELVPDTRPNQEYILLENDDMSKKKALLFSAMKQLTEREKDIMESRVLSETPVTLELLSKKHGISCERVRQIQESAYSKLKNAVLSGAS